MNKKKKYSSLLLTGIFIVASILLIRYTIHISPRLEKIEIPRSKIWYLGKGEYFKDTIVY